MAFPNNILTAAALVASAATCAAAQDDAYVESNLLGILYHELGHAVIDLMQVPIFGQEEDAADVASILLIDSLFENDSAEAIAYDAAFGFLGEAEALEEAGDAPAYWDVHGPDLQRYYNLVCLFVGGDPEGRADLGDDLGLPEERAAYCEDERMQADESWGAVFDEMAEGAPSDSLVYEGDEDSLTEQIIAAEVAELNQVFALPQTLIVRVESCDEPNAFYDPNDVSITMCSEFEDWLRETAPE